MIDKFEFCDGTPPTVMQVIQLEVYDRSNGVITPEAIEYGRELSSRVVGLLQKHKGRITSRNFNYLSKKLSLPENNLGLDNAELKYRLCSALVLSS
jgi:hypothetical protein